jgi:hypothetical protein
VVRPGLRSGFDSKRQLMRRMGIETGCSGPCRRYCLMEPTCRWGCHFRGLWGRGATLGSPNQDPAGCLGLSWVGKSQRAGQPACFRAEHRAVRGRWPKGSWLQFQSHHSILVQSISFSDCAFDWIHPVIITFRTLGPTFWEPISSRSSHMGSYQIDPTNGKISLGDSCSDLLF